MENLKEAIENIDVENISNEDIQHIEEVVRNVDIGNLRVADENSGDWIINEWVRDSILLFFKIRNLKEINANDLIYFDKLEPKKNYEELKLE